MLLKIHAWIYRTFGYYSNYAKTKEWKHIEKNLQKYFDEYVLNNLQAEMKFEHYVGIYIGSWQAKNGFYRSSKQFKRRLKKWKL